LNDVLRSRVLPEALTGLFAVLSALGLLCTRVRTDIDPMLLFVLSSRLPYTKWYAYDPGVQSSAETQRTKCAHVET